MDQYTIGRAPSALELNGFDHKNYMLDSFLGKKRIVLLFVPNAVHAEADFYLTQLGKDENELLERDLLIFVVCPSDSPLQNKRYCETIKTVQTKNEDAERLLFVLIGKDRTVKFRQSNFIPKTKLFAIIDAMPMRQVEIRHQ